MRLRRYLLSTVVTLPAFVVAAQGCSGDSASKSGNAVPPAPVGEACVPQDELCAGSPGATETGATFDFASTTCGTGICMSDHFRGRVSCPFGNKAGRNGLAVPGYEADDADECYVPGTDELVTVPVQPQCRDRKDAVYCTCQCDGPSMGRPLCACPTGMRCDVITASLDPSIVPAGAKFCVRDTDTFDDGESCADDTCDVATDHCGYTANSTTVPSGGSCPGAPDAISTQLYKNEKVDKIDLLFMIDNSASMGDKQLVLASVVPDLVDRFTNPVCIDRVTRQFVAWVPPGAPCPDPATQVREFEPVNDIHIGVITSSIGGHGADSCSDTGVVEFNPRQADMAHLITRGKNPGDATFHDVATYENKGFLNWDPMAKDTPPGESNVMLLSQKFGELVLGAGEDGCGFEAQLESWYRFLVEPAPYVKMIPCPCSPEDTANQCRCEDGLDTMLLSQRADMIRNDSLLAVLMLTDENDCSVADGAQNYLALQALDGQNPFHLARGTNACQSDPWSSDCKSCYQVDWNAYPECAAGWANAEKDDPLNLRCYEQTRRFGLNFLQPIDRYVSALTDRTLPDGTINPLFCAGYAEDEPGKLNLSADGKTCAEPLRDPSRVFLAGIVGVPWQDIARDPSDLSKGYRTASELRVPINQLDNPPPLATNIGGETLWDVILGETDDDGEIVPTVDPLDPLMKESVDPRSGSHPILGDELVLASNSALGNRINGSEWEISTRADLQYACVFTLPEPISQGNDCGSAPINPLCYNETNGEFGYTQYRAKAYPGRRHLAVLKGIGDQAIVASKCPAKAQPSQAGDADWGYRPAIASIVGRLLDAFQGTCWDQQLQPDASGQVPCVVLEASKPNASGACPACDDGTGVRAEASATEKAALAADATFVENGLSCVCKLHQLTDPAELASCIHDDFVSAQGWCYVDASKDPNANTSILASCPADQKRLIRFVGNDVPRAGALTFVQCKGPAW